MRTTGRSARAVSGNPATGSAAASEVDSNKRRDSGGAGRIMASSLFFAEGMRSRCGLEAFPRLGGTRHSGRLPWS